MAEQNINFTQIEFPSDRVTVGTLRRVFPHSFDLPATDYPPKEGQRPLYDHHLYGRNRTELALGNLIDCERVLAARAFKEALSRPFGREENTLCREELVEKLEDLYARLNLSRGPKSAGQLVRSIETQAAAQALKHVR